MVEASEGKVGSTIDKLILTCFQFDPNTGKYTRNALMLMQIGAFLTVAVVVGVIATLMVRDSRRRAALGWNKFDQGSANAADAGQDAEADDPAKKETTDR
ncbi:MAG: hypothetical protein MJA84_04335, partial [Firmicutes bacterium]|nr:hypothetical protein [Bacillota bacterium]